MTGRFSLRRAPSPPAAIEPPPLAPMQVTAPSIVPPAAPAPAELIRPLR